MKQQTMKKLVALAASLAIAGCVAPGSLTAPGAERPSVASVAAKKGAGTVELSVLWPDFRAYGTQAIPYRATKVVVSLKQPDGSAVLDLDGQPIQPATAERGTYGYMDTYGRFSWELPQQEGVEITAELFAGEDVIATAHRTIDIVAGLRSTVALDLVLPDAPTITRVSTTSFRVGDTIVLEGDHFGSSKGWQARVFLQQEYNDGGDDPFSDGDSNSGSAPVYLPDDAVKVESDQRIVVTIPDRIRDQWGRDDFLTNFFWGYFNGEEARLTLGVNVDGVNSPRVQVAMPREAAAKTTISLEQGFDAPRHGAQPQTEVDLVASYSVPVEFGTEWIFEQSGSDAYFNRQRVTVRLRGDDYAEVLREWEYGFPRTDYVFLPDSEFRFLHRIWAMGLQVLPEEDIPLPPEALPPDVPSKAKHLAYSDGGLYDLWVVPNVGPVRMRRVDVYLDRGQPRRNVQEYRLVGFRPAATN